MGIDLNTILGALAGGSRGLAQGLDRRDERQRQAMHDEWQRQQMEDMRQRREYENLGTAGRLADDGITPADAVPQADQIDVGAMAQPALSGLGFGGVVPKTMVPGPGYSYAGQAGGRSYVYNPQHTKEARAVSAKDAQRSAEVARMMTMQKPDGSPVSRAEAEAVVDNNIHWSDLNPKPGPYSEEALSFSKKKIDYQEAARAAAAGRKAAMATGDAAKREKYLNGVADKFVAAAADKAGTDDPSAVLHAVDDMMVDTPEGKQAMREGVRSPHVRAAVIRFRDRLTSKSKPKTQKSSDPFADIGAAAGTAPSAPSAPSAAPARKLTPEEIKKKYGLSGGA